MDQKRWSGISLCRERGYHEWDPIASISEDCDSMNLEAQCKECGACFEGCGDWSNPDDE